jgi:hypothetical protein
VPQAPDSVHLTLADAERSFRPSACAPRTKTLGTITSYVKALRRLIAQHSARPTRPA